MSSTENNRLGLIQAMSISLGGMIGGGIFAVLGLAIKLAKGGTFFSFIVGGLVALITSYSYAKLSETYSSNAGGTVTFINKALGDNVFSGGLNILLWISYIVMLSLYSSAFGAYASKLVDLINNTTKNQTILTTLSIVICSMLNYFSVNTVTVIESWSVIIKLVVLLIFIGISGVFCVKGNKKNTLEQLLSIEHWGNWSDIFLASFVVFVAYEGFELVSNAATYIKPKSNIPKAFYYSISLVICIYCLIAIITVGSLSFADIEKAEEYVLAEVARPILGNFGFNLMTITAVISTFSAINVSLYGASRINYQLAKDNEFPKQFAVYLWKQPAGLLMTAILSIILANTANLTTISACGSIGFLIIFAVINYSAIKLSSKLNSIKFISIIGFILCLMALISVFYFQYKLNRSSMKLAILVIMSCFVIEMIMKIDVSNKNNQKKYEIQQHLDFSTNNIYKSILQFKDGQYAQTSTLRIR